LPGLRWPRENWKLGCGINKADIQCRLYPVIAEVYCGRDYSPLCAISGSSEPLKIIAEHFR